MMNMRHSIGAEPAGVRRPRSPGLGLPGSVSEDEGPEPRRLRGKPANAERMRSGSEMRQALSSPGKSMMRSTSLPARCFLKTEDSKSSPPSPSNGNENWLKTKLDALKEQERVKIRCLPRKEPAVFVETVLTGMGERSVIRQLSPRLRGEGKAIGVHAHKSGGIPWRNLPDYSKGYLQQTMSTSTTGVEKPVRAIGEFSNKLGDCVSKEVIFPEPEVEVEVTKPDEEFEAFLLSMKDCLQSLGGATPSRTRAGSPLVAERHAKYKPQKKYLDSGKDAKDSCPFARNDSNPNAREIRPATARVRVHVNPAVAATGRAGAKDRRVVEAMSGAATIPEKSRVYQFVQDMEQVRCAAYGAGGQAPQSPSMRTRLVVTVKRQDDGKLGCNSTSSVDSTQEPTDSSLRTTPSVSSPKCFGSRSRWR
mmetsp:Transcript_93087/g.221379  ORF Transcript_93087/g.221379 Transcript_93087/m.221379 type:complete len:420 (+) Transcript_93087:122-1381(+)